MIKAWPLVKLGEVLVERQEAPDSIALDNGEIKVVSKIGFNKGEIEFRTDSQTKTGMILIYPGDLVISGINAAKGAIAIYDEKQSNTAAATIHYGSYSVKREKADINFLWWLLRSNTFKEILNRNLPGGIKTELKAKRLLPIKIPLPPLAEQQWIVAKIERLSGKIEEAQQLQLSAESRVDSLFLAYLDNILINLSKTYKKNTLLDLVDTQRGISYGIVQTGIEFDGGVPTLRAGDLQNFRVITENIKHVDPEIEKKYRRTKLEGNEVLLRIRGGLGEVATCPPELISGNVSREIAVIPLSNDTYPLYVMYTIAAPISQNFIQKHVRGTSYVGINLKDVRRLEIPKPPIDIQHSIVRHLQEVRSKFCSLRNIQSKTKKELDAMLPSILDRAFKGEL